MSLKPLSGRNAIILVSGFITVSLAVIVGLVVLMMSETEIQPESGPEAELVVEAQASEQKAEKVEKKEEKPLSPEEKDDIQSSWLFSTSESASLVDDDEGLDTATVGD